MNLSYTQSIETDGPWLRSIQCDKNSITVSSHIAPGKFRELSDSIIEKALPEIPEPVLWIREEYAAKENMITVTITTVKSNIEIIFYIPRFRFSVSVQPTRTIQ